MSTLDKFGAALGVAAASAVFDSRSDDAISSELSSLGIRTDPQQIEELKRALGTSDLERQVERIVPADPSAALSGLEEAFMAGFGLVMALSAVVFALALLVAAVGLRPEPGRRPARRPILPHRTRDAHQRLPGRLEG